MKVILVSALIVLIILIAFIIYRGHYIINFLTDDQLYPPSKNFVNTFFGDNVFFINMDKDKDRLAHMQTTLSRAGIKANRVSGVNKNGEEVKEVSKQSKLRLGELGCSLSHIGIWQNIVEKKIPWTLIFEDDISLPISNAQDYFRHGMSIALSKPDLGIVLFGGCGNGFLYHVQEVVETDLIKGDIISNINCTHCYAISYEGAKQLLSSPNLIKIPIDKVWNKYCSQGNCCLIYDKDDKAYHTLTYFCTICPQYGVVKQTINDQSNTGNGNLTT